MLLLLLCPCVAGVNRGTEALPLAGRVSLECFFMVLLMRMSEQSYYGGGWVRRWWASGL